MHLRQLAAVFLITVTVAGAGIMRPTESYLSRVRGAYADRFTAHGAYISWIGPYRLPKLAADATAVVYGVVVREVKPAEPLGEYLHRSVFEVSVIEYLKRPENADGARILVSQVTEEAQNPLLKPGDACVFFSILYDGVKPGKDAVYPLQGGFARYVVYHGRVFSVSSLDPRYPPGSFEAEEAFDSFAARVRSYMNRVEA